MVLFRDIRVSGSLWRENGMGGLNSLEMDLSELRIVGRFSLENGNLYECLMKY